MLYEIVNQFPVDMIFEKSKPLISLYQPTHRSAPENKQDIIVYKSLVREIENSLIQKYSKKITQSIMKPFYQIEEDRQIWNNTSLGIAVLASQDRCIIYNLNQPVKALSVVADSFHIKPLIQSFQSLERYQLLGLSRNGFSLFEGNRYGFTEIKIDSDTPRTLEEVLGKQLTEPYLTHGSYRGSGKPAMYHGHGDVNEEDDKDIEKYFRYVDRFILDNYSNKSKLPLILVALTELHSQFVKVSNNPYLIKEGINISYDSLDIERLKEKALEIIEPVYLEKMRKFVEAFKEAEAEERGSSDLNQVSAAAILGRVETLLTETDRIIPGKIDHSNGKVKLSDSIDNPDRDDILDDLSELVLKSRGTVIVLPKDMMPVQTGLAAIYRYV